MKKILLLHGWNWKNYTKLTNSKDAWNNRKEFVHDLQKNFEVYKLNFPGFCGEKEPKEKLWNLSDYASYVNDFLQRNKLKVDYILGYSFGGAVAIMYNNLYDKNQDIILISPAIVRTTNRVKRIPKTPACFDAIRKKIRDLYLIYIIKNPYMIYGTPFLKESYQTIVRVELLEDLKSIDTNKINIIYGKNDTQVNPLYVYNNVSEKLKKRIFFINGGHDIANSHTKELIKYINDLK